jgi:hypothetical protein
MTAPSTLTLDFAEFARVGPWRQPLPVLTGDTPVMVAIPSWLGMADRHQLVKHLAPDGTRPVTLVSSTLAATHGHYGDGASQHSGVFVLCLDVRWGWTAGLVRVEPDSLTEVASWAFAAGAANSPIDDSRMSVRLLDHIVTASAAIVHPDSIGTVLVIDTDGARADHLRQAVASGAAFSHCAVLVERDRRVVAQGAAMLGAERGVKRSVGALAHALAVRAPGGADRLAMHVVAAEHTIVPSSTRQAFDLGPNDGSPLLFEVYEQRLRAPGNNAVDHHLVLVAHLVRERGYDQTMLVTFQLTTDGLLSIAPVKAWRLDWQPGSLNLD